MRERTTIFLVEDNDDDAELATRAFRKANATLVRARDGVDALDYLFATGKYAARDVQDLPTVALLDLKMPRLGGLEVLKSIRADVRTRHLPVVILTSSNEDADRQNAYDLFANSYVLKPVNYDEFLNTAQQISLYWTELNKLPPVMEA
jgi:two-component system response regulator